VAAGDVAVSYEMGKQGKIPLGSSVHVTGQRPEDLQVGGYGTVGIAGVDAVVSDSVARSLGLPAGNALVISAPHADLAALGRTVKRLLPRHAGLAQLVAQVEPGTVTREQQQAIAAGAAGATALTPGNASSLSSAQVHAFLTAALSRVGLPYVWGGAGPRVFDCSGLVQWSMRQAGLLMPASPSTRPAPARVCPSASSPPATCSSTTPTRRRRRTSRTSPSTSAAT